MNIAEKDSLALDWVARQNIRVDIVNGKIYNKKGKEIGSFNDRSCTILFNVNHKTHGISRGRLIWLYHYKSIPEGYQVGHQSTDLRNDAIDNLELSTIKERSIKAGKTYKRKSGNAVNAKLTLEQVNSARKQLNAGTISQYKLAKQFGVSKPTLYFAVTGKTWKDATEPVYNKTNVPGKQMQLPLTPAPIAPSINHQANQLICWLLKNNPKLTNAAILKFLKMRNIKISPPAVNTLIKKFKELK